MKRLLALVLSVAMLCSLTACGRSSRSSVKSSLEPGSYADYEASSEYNAAENAAKAKEEWPSTQWRLNCGASATSSWTQAGRYFNALMQESTGGKVKVDIRSNSGYSGGSELDSIQMLMNGDEFDLSIQSGLAYSNFDPRFGVVSLPYLFANTEQADAVLKGSGGKMLKEYLSQYGMFCLGIGENGFQQLTNARRPVQKAADLSGLTIRTGLNEFRQAAFEALNCAPLPLELSEAVGALGTEADGQEAPLALIQSENLMGAQRYVTLWNASYDCVYFCVNQNVYSQLTDDQKKVLTSNAAKAVDYQKEINRRHGQALLDEWKESGKVELLSFEEVDTDSFRSALADAEKWYTEELVSYLGMSQKEAREYVESFRPAEKK